MHFSDVPVKIVGVSECFSALSAKDFFVESFLFFSQKRSKSNVCFHFLNLLRSTWRCLLLVNFQVFRQIPLDRKWFSTFRAELACPICPFFIMCLDMFVEVVLVRCFVRAWCTCVDLFRSFLLFVLPHVVSVLVFPNDVFLTHLARKWTFVMCSWLMNHKIDFLCKRFCKGSPFCSSALNGLIQFNWFPNFYSQISHYR